MADKLMIMPLALSAPPATPVAQGELFAWLSRKYLWWRAPGDGLHSRRRIIAQVMELGTHEDAEALRNAVGDTALADVLRSCEPGWLSAKSWHYWHYALDLAAFGTVAKLPTRRFQ